MILCFLLKYQKIFETRVTFSANTSIIESQTDARGWIFSIKGRSVYILKTEGTLWQKL